MTTKTEPKPSPSLGERATSARQQQANASRDAELARLDTLWRGYAEVIEQETMGVSTPADVARLGELMPLLKKRECDVSNDVEAVRRLYELARFHGRRDKVTANYEQVVGEIRAIETKHTKELAPIREKARKIAAEQRACSSSLADAERITEGRRELFEPRDDWEDGFPTLRLPR